MLHHHLFFCLFLHTFCSFFLMETSSVSIDIPAVIEKIKNPRQTELELKSANLTFENIVSIANALNGSNISVLDLSSNFLDSKSCKVIANALVHSKVTVLILQWTQIDEVGLEAIASVLKKTQVHCLKLADNSLGQSPNSTKIKALTKHLKGTEVFELHLTKNNLNDLDTAEIAHVLNETEINFLHLGSNDIHDVRALANALKDPETKLNVLNLAQNKLIDGGARHIADVLSMTEIVSLDLSDNYMTKDGIQILSNVLNQTLVTNLGVNDDIIKSTNVKLRLEANQKEVNRMNQRFKDLVTIENGKLDFVIASVLSNQSDYKAFIKTIEEKKRRYIGHFTFENSRKCTHKQVKDFVENIHTRFEDSICEAQLLYQRLHDQFKNFVTNENGSLQFKIHLAFTNKSDYEEFTKHISKNQQYYSDRFCSENSTNHTTEQIKNFILNVITRLDQCFQKTDLFAFAFRTFVYATRAGLYLPKPSMDDACDVDSFLLIKDKENYMNYLTSMSDDRHLKEVAGNFFAHIEKNDPELVFRLGSVAKSKETCIIKSDEIIPTVQSLLDEGTRLISVSSIP